MPNQNLIAAIEAEISRLEEIKKLLSDGTSTDGQKRRGPKPKKTAKRVLSPEARKRIADAQKKRWAAAKK